jgi:hypothetical protein
METKFTEQQSLQLITEMINKARNNVQQGSGLFMIFWGVMTAVTALLNIALMYVLAWMSLSPNLSFHIWWIMAPAWVVSFLLERKKDRSAIVKTHINSIISSVWKAFAISYAIFLPCIFGLSYALQEYAHFFYLINPILILTMGIGEYVTAKACRFRPFLHGAVAMWAGSLACVLAIIWFKDGNGVIAQFFILSVCMIIGFVIPGYKLNKSAKAHHV